MERVDYLMFILYYSYIRVDKVCIMHFYYFMHLVLYNQRRSVLIEGSSLANALTLNFYSTQKISYVNESRTFMSDKRNH